MRKANIAAAAIFAASLTPSILPPPPARMVEDQTSSGKDRSKIKAARKQARKTRKKK